MNFMLRLDSLFNSFAANVALWRLRGVATFRFVLTRQFSSYRHDFYISV